MPLPPSYREQNPEVFYSTDPVVAAGDRDLAALIGQAAGNPRLRSRLCTHGDPSAGLHEMLIVHHRDVYVRPHRHIGKPESLSVIDGEALAVLYDDGGGIAEVLEMGRPGSGRCFYYRMPPLVYHSLLIRSEWFVFLEVTAGPFDPVTSQFPDWAPDGGDPASARAFMEDVAGRAAAAPHRAG